MNNKLILGLVLMCMGFFGAILLIGAMVLSPMNPWSWNGITGWYGCLLGMQLQLPFGVCVAGGLWAACCRDGEHPGDAGPHTGSVADPGAAEHRRPELLHPNHML